MAKVADVKLSWIPSTSEDVAGQSVSVSIDGAEAMVTLVAPEVTELMIEVQASRSVIVSVTTTDTEGHSTISEVYTFRIGDLVPPVAATGLTHEIVAVRDVPDPS